MKKIVLTLVAAVIMATLALVVGVDKKVVRAEENTIVKSGTCGENSTWTLDSEGTLEISGSGAIENRAFFGCNDFCSKLIFSEGINVIGDYAFAYCPNFVGDLVLPSEVTSIGDYAFAGCPGFTGRLVLSEGIESIGKSAFSGCYGFTGELVLPTTLTNIAEFTFSGCSGLLGELVIPEGITRIDRYAFAECDSLEKIVIENAECVIADQSHTFPKGAVLSGHTGSTVEAYARKYGREFEVLESAQMNPFTDISEGEYYYQPVLWAVKNNVTAGLSNDEFGPEIFCTRGQVITFIWRANGCPEPRTMSTEFVDIYGEDYYYKAVLWAVEQGIASGTTATTFSPDAQATRGQIVTFLYRAANKPAVNETSCDFNDVEKGAYYYDAVLWAVENAITSGTSVTTFEPDSVCTRGQVVTFLHRMYT